MKVISQLNNDFAGYLLRSFLGIGILGFLGMSCCKPEITSFMVNPDRICGSDTVSITYQIDGNPTLAVVSRGVGSPDTITYTITVEKCGKKVFARHDVLRWITSPEQSMVFMLTPLGRDSLVARDTLNDTTWSARMTISSVVSLSDRPVEVTHLGRSVHVENSGAVDGGLSGLAPTGVWELKSSLRAGEVMGDPQHSPPDRFKIRITLNCPK